MIVSVERVNEVIDSYINLEKMTLSKLDEMDNGKNVTGSAEWKLRNSSMRRISLLEDLRNEIIMG